MKKNILLLLLLAACSFKKNPLGNQTLKGHEELYSEPNNKVTAAEKPLTRIVIAATNDIEGHYQPHIVKFQDDHNNGHQKVRIGGADAISAYFKILRDAYKNVVLVDSGDLFSANASFSDVKKFYESNQYDALTVGMNDFKLKLPSDVKSSAEFFQEFTFKSAAPLVLSNLYELKTGRVVEWKGSHPYLLKDYGGVKVGIIGLLPDDIATLTPVDNRVGLFIENMLQSTLRQARLLRSLGADIVIVLTHQGAICGKKVSEEAKLPLSKVNFEPTKKGVCETADHLGAYLQRLPPHLVDLVVGGRTHEKMANYMNETLAISGFGEGKSFSYVEFFVDTKAKKLVKEKTIIHQPVMFCREFFKETKDCYTEDPSVNHSERMPATFLGKELDLITPVDDLTFIPESEVDVVKALKDLSADLAFLPKTSKNTQLMSLKVSGKSLIRMMEEDFNQNNLSRWFPNPFKKQGNKLTLKLDSEMISPHKDYTLLADLDAIQSEFLLRKAMKHYENKAHMHLSWKSFDMEDSVNTTVAAQKR